MFPPAKNRIEAIEKLFLTVFLPLTVKEKVHAFRSDLNRFPHDLLPQELDQVLTRWEAVLKKELNEHDPECIAERARKEEERCKTFLEHSMPEYQLWKRADSYYLIPLVPLQQGVLYAYNPELKRVCSRRVFPTEDSDWLALSASDSVLHLYLRLKTEL